MMARTSDEGRVKVAVVGTGMAGLVTAYLLNSNPSRYEVHVFESGASPSLDAASVDFQDADGRAWRIDVPMRAFTDGYYHNLRAMYDFFGIRYRRQRLRYVFSQMKHTAGASVEQPYFTHTSNQYLTACLESRPAQIGWHLIELCFVVVGFAWFTICCFLVQPGVSDLKGLDETLRDYVQRIMLPQRFVMLYLLPLFSAVATCSHQELLDFPASDIVNYRKAILFREHYVVSDGIQKVQSSLTQGLKIHTQARVSKMESLGSAGGWKITTTETDSNQPYEYICDRVILAIPPNESAALYSDLRKSLSRLPTRQVTTIAHNQRNAKATYSHQPTEIDEIHLCTALQHGGWTEARHDHQRGVSVMSNISSTSPIPSRTFSKSTFTRVLRDPVSKQIVDQMFGLRRRQSESSKPLTAWKNGENGIWMAGAWCWDGMVLLEGAVVSAMRVASDFDIEIPW